MHDAVSGELAGTPAVGVMTTGFVDAAELMASALGVPGYRFAVIDHPISNASDDALEARARATLAQARPLLLRADGPRGRAARRRTGDHGTDASGRGRDHRLDDVAVELGAMG
ncbi:MAG: hypothetical protein FJW83_09420 [Actinobacteria bacterium]|nr:hypothetical protein [Actinomycetota bacterium]